MGEEKDIWDHFFHPEVIDDLREPFLSMQTLTVQYFKSAEGPAEALTIEPFFPFYTIDDIKLAIYKAKGNDIAFAPDHQFLSFPLVNPGRPAPPETRGAYYVAADAYWTRPGEEGQIRLQEPFTAARAAAPDSNFVDSAGARRILNFVNRGRSLFEDIFLVPTGGNPPALHLFLLRDIQFTNPALLGSQVQHAGRIESYFPHTTPASTGTKLEETKKKHLDELFTYFDSKLKLLQDIVPLIEEGVSKLPTLKFIKKLRLVWLEKRRGTALDSTFFDATVSNRRPFLRLMPADGAPISKVHVKNGLKIPDLADPCLLLQWAKEKNPIVEKDYVFGKIYIEQLFKETVPMYATLQLADDGTAGVVLQPSKQQKKIDIAGDLRFFKKSIKEGIADLPFADGSVELDAANLIATLRIDRKTKISYKEMRRRLGIFRGFFQEVPPLEGEEPLISLRYKVVSQFVSESRIDAFLTQLRDRNLYDGPNAIKKMIEDLAEEFSLTEDDANAKFRAYIEKRKEIIAVEPLNDVFRMTNNPGIDILIFAQHPFYTLHLYRVDSYINLRRILTFLTLMLTSDLGDVATSEKQGVAFEASAAKAQVVAQVQAQALPAQAITEVPDEADVDLGLVDDFGMFEDTEDAEEAEPQAQPAAPMPQPQQPQPQQQPQKASASLTQPTANYFIRKLQEADSRLFEYTKGRKDLKKYVSACQAPEGRQPVVLDKAGYDRMMAEYKEDIDNEEVDIITYGYDKGILLPGQPRLTKYKTNQDLEDHTFSVLKYGTDLTNQHFYLCSEFYCIRDQILVRKDEFEGTKFRASADQEFAGKPKQPNHCPFCNGTLIQDLSKPGPGQTVYQRPVKKPSAGKRHTHIGFYAKKLHPEGFSLPCCFTMKQTIRPVDDDFRILHEMAKKLTQAEPTVDAAEEDKEEQVTEEKVIPIPNYQDVVARAHRKYILGAEKMPLEIGNEPQIGLLPTQLNAYFKQNPADLVQRVEITQQLKVDASGFFRVGVDNRTRFLSESFFAAVAPFIRRNTADQVRERLHEVITPKVFVSANYGNLMLEFFDLKTPERGPTTNEIREFATKKLQLLRIQQNPFLSRIWRAYTNFKDDLYSTRVMGTRSFLENPQTVKEYRQFAQIFAQPGLVTERGIVFIILDISDDSTVTVKCPPYGFTESMKSCDIGLLLYKNGLWEPIFHSRNIPGTATTAAMHVSTLRFQRALQATWPAVLKERVDEFMIQCKGPDTAIYTGIQQVKKGSLLMTLTTATTLFKDIVYGVVRDTYNHIVAVTIVTEEGNRESPLITVPVTDDGVLRTELQIHLNWEGYTPASVTEVMEFYKVNSSRLSYYKGYMPEYAIIPGKKDKIEAIQLANGIFIPVQPTPFSEGLGLKLPPSGQPEVLEWDINRAIVFPGGKEIKLDLLQKVKSETELEEIYEHFRLTFSNWLSSAEAGPALRTEIKEIIMRSSALGFQLPLYEKRMRLEIILGPVLSTWFDSAPHSPKAVPSLRRVDCRAIREAGQCSAQARCAWKQAEGEEDGACLLHVPNGDSARMFVLRLIDELIRFPMRRDQLLKEKKKSVSILATLRGATLTGTQYIVPEDSLEWTDLLRMDCRRQTTEKKLFAEEFSGVAPMVATAATAQKKEDPLPTEVTLLTDDYALAAWNRDLIPLGTEVEAIASQMSISPEDLNYVPGKQFFTQEELWKLVIAKRTAVVQINLLEPDLSRQISGWRVMDGVSLYVIVVTAEGPQFLVEKGKPVGPILEASLPGPFRDRVQKIIKRKLKV